MPKWGYLIIAISIIALLVVVFVWSFVAYKKTPVPKGCEDILPEDTKCASCSEYGCFYNKNKEAK